MKEEKTMQGMGFIVIYIVFFAALIYFTSIRPQKKERQKQQEMLSSIAVGDTILTTSGFYGVIIDMTFGDWYFTELTALMMVMCLIAGFMAGYDLDKIINIIIKGAAELVSTALIADQCI